MRHTLKTVGTGCTIAQSGVAVLLKRRTPASESGRHKRKREKEREKEKDEE